MISVITSNRVINVKLASVCYIPCRGTNPLKIRQNNQTLCQFFTGEDQRPNVNGKRHNSVKNFQLIIQIGGVFLTGNISHIVTNFTLFTPCQVN